MPASTAVAGNRGFKTKRLSDFGHKVGQLRGGCLKNNENCNHHEKGKTATPIKQMHNECSFHKAENHDDTECPVWISSQSKASTSSHRPATISITKHMRYLSQNPNSARRSATIARPNWGGYVRRCSILDADSCGAEHARHAMSTLSTSGAKAIFYRWNTTTTSSCWWTAERSGTSSTTPCRRVYKPKPIHLSTRLSPGRR